MKNTTRYLFEPKQDITAWELAQIYKHHYSATPAKYAKMDEKVKRHLTPIEAETSDCSDSWLSKVKSFFK